MNSTTMKRKYELNNFEPYQFADIRDHLEAMALRGWRLERMERYFLVYRRGEPKPVRYALVFHPEMGYLEPAPTQEGEVYRDYCRQAGCPKSRSTAMRSPTPSPSRPTGPFSGG